jgi:hypothetical protein
MPSVTTLDPIDYQPTRLALKLDPPSLALEYKTFNKHKPGSQDAERLWIHKIPLPLPEIIAAAVHNHTSAEDEGPETDEDGGISVDSIVQDTMQLLEASDHHPYLTKIDMKQVKHLIRKAAIHHFKEHQQRQSDLKLSVGSAHSRASSHQSPVEREIANTRVDCWMDIEIDGRPAGRIVVHLRDDVVPKTAANFRRICAGNARSKTTGDNSHRCTCIWESMRMRCSKSKAV